MSRPADGIEHQRLNECCYASPLFLLNDLTRPRPPLTINEPIPYSSTLKQIRYRGKLGIGYATRKHKLKRQLVESRSTGEYEESKGTNPQMVLRSRVSKRGKAEYSRRRASLRETQCTSALGRNRQKQWLLSTTNSRAQYGSSQSAMREGEGVGGLGTSVPLLLSPSVASIAYA